MSLPAPYMPVPLDALTVIFPADVSDLMPAMDEIPEDFHRNRGEARPWIKFQMDWFYSGLANPEYKPKEGIDLRMALTHLKAIQGSFQPKHQEKEAAVAYLASLWFESVPTYEIPDHR